jgi:hypothetical protein
LKIYREDRRTQKTIDDYRSLFGFYWGLKLVNGRDYFMKWQGDYWKRLSANVVTGRGRLVKWRTVYHLLDENQNITLTETANWSLQESEGKYLLALPLRRKFWAIGN